MRRVDARVQVVLHVRHLAVMPAGQPLPQALSLRAQSLRARDSDTRKTLFDRKSL
jgi:hypothetical protein